MKRLLVVLMMLTACRSHAPAIESIWNAPAPAYVGMPAVAGRRVAVTYGHSYLALVGQWQTRFVGLRDVAPTFDGDRVLAATDVGLAAFALDDGRLLWRRELGDRPSTPVVAGRRVVVTTWGGRVVMLDAWSVELPGPSLGPPVIHDDIVVASWDGGVTALDAETGAVRWQREFDGADTSAPAIFGRLAVVAGGDRRAHALDLATGRERWSIAMKGAGSPEAPPVVDGDQLAIVDRLGHLVVVGGDGRVKWTAEGRGAVVRSGPVWVADAVAQALDDGRVMVATAEATRFHDLPGQVSGLAATGDSVIVATREAATNGLLIQRQVP